jgi:hypothetical protein
VLLRGHLLALFRHRLPPYEAIVTDVVLDDQRTLPTDPEIDVAFVREVALAPAHIGIAESTVKVHRTNLMRKMQARSLPELSRMADMLELAPKKA